MRLGVSRKSDEGLHRERFFIRRLAFRRLLFESLMPMRARMIARAAASAEVEAKEAWPLEARTYHTFENSLNRC